MLVLVKVPVPPQVTGEASKAPAKPRLNVVALADELRIVALDNTLRLPPRFIIVLFAPLFLRSNTQVFVPSPTVRLPFTWRVLFEALFVNLNTPVLVLRTLIFPATVTVIALAPTNS